MEEQSFYFFSWQDIKFLQSELLLVVAWVLAFCGLLLPKKISSTFVPLTCSIAFLANIFVLIFFTDIATPVKTTFFWNDLFYQNRLTHYLKILTSVSAILAIWIQLSHKKDLSEWFVVLLGGVLSAQFLVVSANIFGVYISLEMLSICGYLLVSFSDKGKEKLIASSFNYLAFGAVSAACLLYGFSWWYGVSGSFSIPQIFETTLTNTDKSIFLIGFVLIGIGFLFKLAAIPLHFWISEVYKNSSAGTVFFLATIPKIVASGVLFFVLSQSIHLSKDLQEIVFSALSLLGVLSAIFGGFLAIQQSSFKCFFAYSGVAQVGFLLLLLVYNFKYATISENGLLLFWVFYIISNAIIWKFCAELENDDNFLIKDLNKLPISSKLLLSLASLSLAGFPPLGGFLVKIVVIFIAFQNYQNEVSSVFLLSLIGVGIATLIGFFYYLKVPYLLFLKSSASKTQNNLPIIRLSTSTLFISAVLILLNIGLVVFALRWF
ncbi:NADH-quinone oxidoreductase subunit N [Bernardetia sp.]|uniref:NADH-quinone oxidoreductase subunit N n=1 Tax=Bernardetia sp. TaxID=1937974 RepID=UPI0025C19641|nr:proton-conducting transporter membrane subunit [Bernardetia sp.]